MMVASDGEFMEITAKVTFAQSLLSKAKPVECRIKVAADGSDSLKDVTQKISAAFDGKVPGDHLQLYFGPNERRLGNQFLGDPSVDEASLKLSEFSVLNWLKRFPHWQLGVRLMPAPPPAPGVATFRAAAISEGKDPDQAVQEARTKGEIPMLAELPAPWGPKPYVPNPADVAAYAPPKFPAGFSPLKDTAVV